MSPRPPAAWACALGGALAWSFTVLALSVLVAWGVGRLGGDRLYATQFLSWIPTFAAIGIAGTALAAAWIVARLLPPRPRAGGQARRVAARGRLVGGVVLAAAAASLVVEWRLFNPGREVRGPALRVAFWNVSVASMPDLDERVAPLEAGVLIVTGAPMNTPWARVRAAMGEPTSVVRFGRFTLVSRHRVLRWGGTTLGVEGAKRRVFRWQGGGNISIDRGEALFAELDTTALWGRTTVVWAVDLPSDPGLWRARVMREARASIDAFRGPVQVRDEADLDVAATLDPPGFPAPDLIVGDFNTPRGSPSLDSLTGGLPHAHAQAGRGPAFTWPRGRPLLAIDHVFVGAHLRAAAWRVVDPRYGAHRIVTADVVGAAGGPGPPAAP